MQVKDKKRRIVCAVAMSLAVIYCLGLIAVAVQNPSGTPEYGGAAGQSAGFNADYANRIFDTGYVHEIRIEIPDSQWESLKNRSLYKDYYDSTVTVDGETFYHVGIRTKGNVTLLQSIMRDWDRYSLVMNFGAFDSSQRYHGLDMLALNNNICDSSFMRDYLCYDMMRSMDIPTPLCSYTALYLNGEYLGLYTTVECMSESFAIRNFGYCHGNLYKPEQMNIAGMLTGKETDCRIDLSVLSGESGSVDAADFLGVSDVTVGLNYQGDALNLYNDIWDNAIFKVGNSDKRRMVESIKTICEGEYVGAVLYTDTLLRYFAVNCFILNDDCYISYAGHNYGLYEKDGKLMLIPWDYDHSLGCMGASCGRNTWMELLNLPIDEPLIGVEMDERPLLKCLLTNDEYREEYYAYLDSFLSDYVESGRLERTVAQLTEMLLTYVRQEPEGGVSEERFNAAIKSNMDFCAYRTASIRGQLAGDIPSTAAAQAATPDTLINCSEFVSPDSGSLTELLFPAGSGLYLEDLLDALIPRINTSALISVLPVDTIMSLAGFGDEGEGNLMVKLESSGLVNDSYALNHGIRLLVLNFAKEIIPLLLAPLCIIVALIFVFRYGNSRLPTAKKKGGGRHAV
ncbi:MAG: CotH kinase family protein [Eubacteriales bacterium]